MPTIDYHIRIDRELQEQVFPILASHGLTPAQAFNLFLTHIKRTGEIPLSLDPVFSAETLKAFAELENGEYSECTLEELLESKNHA